MLLTWAFSFSRIRICFSTISSLLETSSSSLRSSSIRFCRSNSSSVSWRSRRLTWWQNKELGQITKHMYSGSFHSGHPQQRPLFTNVVKKFFCHYYSMNAFSSSSCQIQPLKCDHILLAIRMASLDNCRYVKRRFLNLHRLLQIHDILPPLNSNVTWKPDILHGLSVNLGLNRFFMLVLCTCTSHFLSFFNALSVEGSYTVSLIRATPYP